MNKLWVVAVREYRAAVKSKAFIVTLVAMPVLMGGAIVVQSFLKDKVDTQDQRVAIIDRSGELADTLEAAAKVYNEKQIYDSDDGERTQVKPKIVLERVDPKEADAAPESTLRFSDRVRSRELFAFVEIGPNVLANDPAAKGNRITYHSNAPMDDSVRRWVAAVVNRRVQQIRSRKEGIDAEVLQRVNRPVPIENLGLVQRDTSTGEISEPEKVDVRTSLFVPMGMMMLIFLAVMVGATPLVQTVLEEKMARISEVLLGSVRPFTLMLGKLLGTVGVSVTIVTLYLIGAYLVLEYAGYTEYFPSADRLMWFFLFQGLAVLMYGALFSAVGAAVTDMREAQSTMMPVMIVAMSPMFVWLQVVKAPTSTFATVLSLIPPATPMLMPLRQSVPQGIPLWQPLLGIALVVVATIACVYASAKIFRTGILMHGKGASFAQMCVWIFRK